MRGCGGNGKALFAGVSEVREAEGQDEEDGGSGRYEDGEIAWRS